jgi:hypothetical protein
LRKIRRSYGTLNSFLIYVSRWSPKRKTLPASNGFIPIHISLQAKLGRGFSRWHDTYKKLAHYQPPLAAKAAVGN